MAFTTPRPKVFRDPDDNDWRCVAGSIQLGHHASEDHLQRERAPMFYEPYSPNPDTNLSRELVTAGLTALGLSGSVAAAQAAFDNPMTLEEAGADEALLTALLFIQD